VTLILVFQGFDALDLAKLPDQMLDVRRRTVPGDRHQVFLVLRRRDAGHRADLGKADDALTEPVADLRQFFQCMCNPHSFTHGAEANAHRTSSRA